MVLWLVLGATLAGIVFPFYLVYYVLTTVRERRRELARSITARVADAYLKVFAPQQDSARRSPEARVLGNYDLYHGRERYVWAGLLTWLMLAFDLVLVAFWIHAKLSPAPAGGGAGPVLLQVPDTVFLALLGGLVWVHYEVIERGRVGDLTPDRLLRLVYRLLLAVPLGYVCALIPPERGAELVAFTASAFPLRQIQRQLRTRALRLLQEGPPAPGAASARQTIAQEDHLRFRVAGISPDSLARLEEVGVITTVDLAYADPIRLSVETGFELRILMDWMDQSLLALYVGDKMSELPRLGVRGAMEASSYYREHIAVTRPRGEEEEGDDHDELERDEDGFVEKWQGYEEDPDVVKLVELLGTTPGLLADLLFQIDGDPHLAFISAVWGTYAVVLDAEGA